MHRLVPLALLLALAACRADDSKPDTANPDGECTWYTDADGDGYGDPDSPATGSCDDEPSGFVGDDSDCDDGDSAVNPGGEEVCNGIDDDCDGQADEDAADAGTFFLDGDDDGYGDAAGTVTACEAPDGFVDDDTDCDDSEDQTHPGAAERCDGVDNDCDDEIDEDLQELWYADADNDGFGNPDSTTESCDPGAGWVADSSDCDDANSSVNPEAEEVCNDLDDDCDGEVDEDLESTWYQDADSDGFGDPDVDLLDCEPGAGWVDNAADCDDANSEIHPEAEEACNGYDDDCDGLVDDEDTDVSGTSTWYQDADGDGYGDATSTAEACDVPSGHVDDDTDCDDGDAAVNPGATEICNDTDDDCDGDVDDDDASVSGTTTWYIDYDGDGYGGALLSLDACDQPSNYVSTSTDCDDSDAASHPGADETCDGADNDCDGTVDEDDATDATTWYQDADGDGYGDASSATAACSAPSGHVSDATDCDDGDGAINPGADELCSGVDDDCDGTIDEDEAVDAHTFYADRDGDGYGDATNTTVSCYQPSDTVTDASDCDDGDAAINPAASEVCDGVDNDCDGDVDDDDSDVTGTTTWYVDYDGDGYGGALVSQDACDQPSNYVADATDCDDGDAATNPGATETCDAVDNDCDGDVDEGVSSSWYLDYDGDGYGDSATAVEDCSAPSTYYVSDGTDCDDVDAAVHPGATPGCDGRDYDCDGLVDNDADGDGYADAACGGDDCDDGDATILPEVGGGCALGTTCLDILDLGRSVGDGDYTIDPDGYGTGVDPFEVTCDMTTDGGGWTEIAYDADLTYQQHFTDGDYYRYMDDDFTFELTEAQIEAIQDASSEGWQYYEGWCEHVVHYYYDNGANYDDAFGFMFYDGTETPYATSSYSPHAITVTHDGCSGNGGEGGDPDQATIFEIESVLVPVLNVQCRDCGDDGTPEMFGSPLTDNPAWLR